MWNEWKKFAVFCMMLAMQTAQVRTRATGDASKASLETKRVEGGLFRSRRQATEGEADGQMFVSGFKQFVDRVAVHETIVNWHNYTYDGTDGRSIRDGGSDMFDDGNKVSCSIDGVEYFGENGIKYNEYFHENKTRSDFFAVASYPFAALLLAGGLSSGASIQVRGNAGADNSGNITSDSLATIHWEDFELETSYVQVSGAGEDPSICEVFYRVSSKQHFLSEVDDSPVLEHGSETNRLSSKYTSEGRNFIMGYLLLSKENAEPVSEAEVIGATCDFIFPFAIEMAGMVYQATYRDEYHYGAPEYRPVFGRPNENESDDKPTTSGTYHDRTRMSSTAATPSESASESTTDRSQEDAATEAASVPASNNEEPITTRKMMIGQDTASTDRFIGEAASSEDRTTEDSIETVTGNYQPTTEQYRSGETASTYPYRTIYVTGPFDEDRSSTPQTGGNEIETGNRNVQSSRGYTREFTQPETTTVFSLNETISQSTVQMRNLSQSIQRSVRRLDIESKVSSWNTYNYDNSDDRVHNYISDGGRDMYDGGNRIRFYVDDEEVFADQETRESFTYNHELVTDDYKIAVEALYPFAAALHFGIRRPQIGKITVYGNAGADGSGHRIGKNLYDTFTWQGFSLSVSYSQVFGAGSDPSICEVFFRVYNEELWGSQVNGAPHLTYGYDTNNLNSTYTSQGSNVLIGYLLMSKTRGKKVTEDEILTVTKTFAFNLCADLTSIDVRYPESEDSDTTSVMSSVTANQQPELYNDSASTASTFVPRHKSSISSSEVAAGESDLSRAIQRSVRRLDIESKVSGWNRYNYDNSDNENYNKYISDGGSDMYDGGNRVKFYVDSEEVFTKSGDRNSAPYNRGFITDDYQIAVEALHPFVAALKFGIRGYQSGKIKVYGNAGADGRGRQVGKEFSDTFTWQGFTLSVAYSQVFGAPGSDPSICEVFFRVYNEELWGSRGSGGEILTYNQGTNELLSSYATDGSNILIGYLLLSKMRGRRVTDEEILTVAKTFVFNLCAELTPEITDKYSETNSDNDGRDYYNQPSTPSYGASYEIRTTEIAHNYSRFITPPSSRSNDTETRATLSADVLNEMNQLARTVETNVQRLHVAEMIPQWHRYVYDRRNSGHTYIHDGGADMYDGGNKIQFFIDGEKVLSNRMHSNIDNSFRPPPDNGFKYDHQAVTDSYKITTTALWPFVATLQFGKRGPQTGMINVYGNAGADGYGVHVSHDFDETFTWEGFHLSVSYAQIYDASDPSICQVFFHVANEELWESRVDAAPVLQSRDSTQDLNSTYTAQGSNVMIGYLLLSKSYGMRVTDEEILSVTKSFAFNLCADLTPTLVGENVYNDSRPSISNANPDGYFSTTPPTQSYYNYSAPAESFDRETEEANLAWAVQLNAERLYIEYRVPDWNRYNYDNTDSRVNNYISDGGSDMYDGGNYVRFLVDNELIQVSPDYSEYGFTYNRQHVTKDHAAAIAAVHPFVAILQFGKRRIQTATIKVNGNAGADGSGVKIGKELQETFAWEGFHLSISYSQVYDAHDPSICQVFFRVYNEELWGSNVNGTTHLDFTRNTNTLYSTYTSAGTNILIGYLLLSKSYGRQVTDEEILSVTKSFAFNLCADLTRINARYTNGDDYLIASSTGGNVTTEINRLTPDRSDLSTVRPYEYETTQARSNDERMKRTHLHATIERTVMMLDVASMVPGWNIYAYDEGALSNHINDGGGDMYDDGNYVRFYVDGEQLLAAPGYLRNGFPYGRVSVTQDYEAAAKALHPFVATLQFGIRYPQTGKIVVIGNAGADGSGRIKSKVFNQTFSWEGFHLSISYSQVYNAGNDPSICQVFFRVYNEWLWASHVLGDPVVTFGSDTNELNSTYTAQGSNVLIGYLLLSKKRAEMVTDEEILKVTRTFVFNLCADLVVPVFSVYSETSSTTALSLEDDYRNTSSTEGYQVTTDIYDSSDLSTARPYEYETTQARSNDERMSIMHFPGTIERIVEMLDVASMVPRWNNYTYDQESFEMNHINDGGGDMYDDGNYVQFFVDGEQLLAAPNYLRNGFPYDRVSVTQDYEAAVNALHPFVATLQFGIRQPQTGKIVVRGDAGADDMGRVKSKVFNQTFSWEGFHLSISYSQVYNAGNDPSICQVFFRVYNERLWASQVFGDPVVTYSSDTNDLNSTYTAQGSNVLIGYLLLSKKRAEMVTDEEILKVTRTFVFNLCTDLVVPVFSVYSETSSTTALSLEDYAQKERKFAKLMLASERILEEQLPRIDMNSLMHRWHKYNYDSTAGNFFIQDGGSDMYDSGNYVYFKVSGQGHAYENDNPFRYNHTMSEDEFKVGIVASHPFVAFAFIGRSGPQSVTITVRGEAGADGGGRRQPRTYLIPIEAEGYTIESAYTELSEARNDPSICEVFFKVRSEEHWGSVIGERDPSLRYEDSRMMLQSSSSTENLDSRFTVSGTRVLAGYLLLSKTSGWAVNPSEIRRVLSEVIYSLVSESNYIDVEEEGSGTEDDTGDAQQSTYPPPTNSSPLESSRPWRQSNESVYHLFPGPSSSGFFSSFTNESTSVLPGPKETLENFYMFNETGSTSFFRKNWTSVSHRGEYGNYSVSDYETYSAAPEAWEEERMDVEESYELFKRLVSAVNQTTPLRITDSVSRFYKYDYDGADGASISTGGKFNYMFADGNRVSLTIDNGEPREIRYNEFYHAENVDFAATTAHPFAFYLYISNQMLNNEHHTCAITVRGRAGGDGGRVFSWQEQMFYGEDCLIRYFVFQSGLSTSTDPSICEVYYVLSCGTWQSETEDISFRHSNSSRDLNTTLTVSGNHLFVSYLLLSKSLGSVYRDGEVRSIIRIAVRDLLETGEKIRRSHMLGNEMETISLNVTNIADVIYYPSDSGPLHSNLNSSLVSDGEGNSPREVVERILGKTRSVSGATMQAFVPGFYAYQYDGDVIGKDGEQSSISDGGNDMFDDGNKIYFGVNNTDLSGSKLAFYNQIYSDEDKAYGTITSHPFVAIMWANNTKNDDSISYSIEVRGNAGADGEGRRRRMEGRVDMYGFRLDYHAYEVSGAGTDPSICEVYFLVTNQERWGSRLRGDGMKYSHVEDSENLWGVARVTGDKILLGYTLLSKLNGAQTTQKQLEASLQPLLFNIITETTTGSLHSEEVSPDDYPVSPTCGLNKFVHDFYQHCLVKEDPFASNSTDRRAAWYTPKHYNGTEGCMSELSEMLSCASDLLLGCLWSVDESWSRDPNRYTPSVSFKMLQMTFADASRIDYRSYNTLNVFCHHAPLGLPFPYPTFIGFYNACENELGDLLRSALADFYRSHVWAPHPRYIRRNIEDLYERVDFLLHKHCLTDEMKTNGRRPPQIFKDLTRFRKVLLNSFASAISSSGDY